MESTAETTAWGPEQPASPPCTITPESEKGPGCISTESGDLYFVNAGGTPRGIGETIGRRLADPIRRGPIPFFTTFLSHILRKSAIRRASNVAQWASHQWATKQLIAQLPDYFETEMSAMAEALDMREASVARALTLPETYLWMIGSYHRFRGTARAPGLGHPPIGGCTSAVVRPPASSAGLLHGRNLDYHGIGYWEPTATATFYHPDDALDYVSVGAAGLLGGGITGMNAAGITLAVHQHVVDRFNLKGDPVGVAGDQVMRRARTLDEAIAILRDHEPVAGWSYVLTEGDTGEVAVYETAPDHEPFVCRLPDDETHLGYANVYWGSNFEDAEIDYYPEYRRDAHARQSRVLDKTSRFDEDDPADPESIASILADFKDPASSKIRLIGRSIAAVHTVTSVVFEPAERRVWVGTGTSPASRSWFVPLSMESSARPGWGGPDLEASPFHPSPDWMRSEHGQAFDLYRKACVRFREGESDKHLMIFVEHALALYGEEPSLHMLAGLLALRLDRPRRAEGAFRRALERATDLARRAEIEL